MTSATPPMSETPVTDSGLPFAIPYRPSDGPATTILIARRRRKTSSRVLRPAELRRMANKRKRMNVYDEGGVTVMDLGAMDIWDGADLALIRDTLTALIVREQRRRIGVDMTHVKYIPSGFFGMLFDWKERGVEVYLFDPQPNVRNMLWFRQFAERVAESAYRLTSVPQEELRPEGVGHWEDDHDDICAAASLARAR
jgi:hypothetical protein